MTESSVKQRISEQVVAALPAALGNRLIAVVLFGSRARGDASAESDWDFLIIAEGLPQKPFQRRLLLKRLLPPECAVAVSLLVRTLEEFEAHLSSLYLDVALDGQVLYDPQGYMSNRLSNLRRLIDKKGLSRQRTQAGDIWRWRQQEPSEPWSLEWGM